MGRHPQLLRPDPQPRRLFWGIGRGGGLRHGSAGPWRRRRRFHPHPRRLERRVRHQTQPGTGQHGPSPEPVAQTGHLRSPGPQRRGSPAGDGRHGTRGSRPGAGRDPPGGMEPRLLPAGCQTRFPAGPGRRAGGRQTGRGRPRGHPGIDPLGGDPAHVHGAVPPRGARRGAQAGTSRTYRETFAADSSNGSHAAAGGRCAGRNAAPPGWNGPWSGSSGGSMCCSPR